MTEENQYDLNFFKPLSGHAKANKKLILILATIWAIAVFGFQIALMLFNEPMPEKSYTVFQSVWPQVVEDETATNQMRMDFANTLLAVLGKNVAVKQNHKEVLKETLSWTLLKMQPDSMQYVFRKAPDDESISTAKASLGLEPTGFDKIKIDLLPSSLTNVENNTLSEENKQALPGIMELYLVHNQSFLTNFTFIGFPFHYWYTAQFLLILFVVLCLIYARVTDKMNKKFDFVEET